MASSRKPSGSSRSAAVGSRSGCVHTPSRASAPWRVRSEPHSVEASRSRRGRSSSPTSDAKVCSAGPPAARRRRTASWSLAAAGIRSAVAWPTTSSTQPSTSARVTSSRDSAACWAGVCWRSKSPPSKASCIDGRVARVEPAQLLLDGVGVDLDAAGVVARPRRSGGRAARARARTAAGGRPRAARGRAARRRRPRRDPRRTPRRWPAPARPCPSGPSGRPMSEAVSTSPASAAEPGADLAGDHRAGGLAEHAEQRAGHRPGLLGQRVAEGRGGLRGDRLDEHLPHVGGADDPLGAPPGGGRGHAGRERRGGVEPVVGEADRVGDLVLLLLGDAGVGRWWRPACGPCRARGPS